MMYLPKGLSLPNDSSTYSTPPLCHAHHGPPLVGLLCPVMSLKLNWAYAKESSMAANMLPITKEMLMKTVPFKEGFKAQERNE
jgi:hypothetical protein